MDPIFWLDVLVAFLTPVVMALRAPAAVVLFLIVAFRPKSESHCIMLGRYLVLVACIFWVVAGIPEWSACGTLGNWTMFLSAMASHVCEVAMNWASVVAAKRAESPSAFARIWHAFRHRQGTPV
ncbi:hypothetical protein UFOVP860_92 [uncultured Caudovirales phage]|uniref:Uncharacterized protein n=1 Tax=uncultured Caudovirales phage TaxID=2100421 RepID=A0A6J5T4H3_9CAUD|nr:hypothetical protein UFOVP860_92 [uncultured Caudovirales phage]CAB4195229.1 hypothetical protein UFOVP1293_19 [uncultured Caudovirales phage]CAB4222450.1 hypothetical protein UFOVP1644_37 [uncultured Caudovirales phage]